MQSSILTFSDALAAVVLSAKGIDDMAVKPMNMEAEVIVRLEEMLEGGEEVEPSLTDLPEAINALQANVRTLAYGVLLLLRKEESEALGYKHVFDSHFKCMRCGKSRAEVDMPGSIKICTGGV